MRQPPAIVTTLLVWLTAVSGASGGNADTSAATVGSPLGVECFHALGENGLFLPRQPISLSLTVRNAAATSATLEVAVRIKDFWGRPVARQTLQVAVAGSAKRHEWTMPGLERNGFYCVDAAVRHGEQVIGNVQCGLCVVPPAERRDPYFGMDKNGLTTNLFKSYALIGVGSLGMGWDVWSTYRNPRVDVREAAKRWTAPESLNGRILSSDFRVVGYVGIDTPHSDEIADRRQKGLYPYPDKMFERFGESVAALSQATKDRIKLWIVQQEIDARVGDPKAPAGSGVCEMASHVLLTRLAYKNLKKGNPDCRVAALGICCVDYFYARPPFNLTRMILRDTQGHYDYLAIDAYAGNWNGCQGPLTSPEAGSLRKLLVDSARLQREFKKEEMVVNAEQGWGIPYHRPFDHAQNVHFANYTARSLIINKSVPSTIYHSLHMGTYEGLGQRLKRENRTSTDSRPVLDLGLWKNEVNENGKTVYLPRPVVAAYATTARLLAFTTNPEEVASTKELCCYLFRKNGQSLAALWTTDQPRAVAIDLPDAAEHCDLMGNRTALPPGKAEIKLGESPVFVITATKPEKLKQTLGKMTFSSPPRKEG